MTLNEDLLDFLIAPDGKHRLRLESPVYENGRVKSGYLVSGNTRYVIKDFIPRFVNSDLYAASFGYEWHYFKKTQLDFYTGTTISRDRWTNITGYKPEHMAGKIVLEAGCGSGRFLEVVAPYAKKTIGVDLSRAVDAARDNLIDKHNSIDFVQADLNNLPIKNDSVDFLYSIGVLHHIPHTLNGIKALLPCVKPQGEVAVWLYGPRAFSPLPMPVDLYRFIGSRLNPEIVLKFLKKYVPLALLSHRIPVIGKIFKYILFWAADYPHLPIPRHLKLDWSILDTFDTFATKIEKHFREEEVRLMLLKAGLTNIRKGNVYNSFIGQKPA